jgi:hypothetical protein
MSHAAVAAVVLDAEEWGHLALHGGVNAHPVEVVVPLTN